MGVGEPDEMAFPDCVDALATAAAKPDNRTYADNGGALFKEAAARWMQNVCGVSGLDPATNIVHSIGSKAALSILPACLINPGDVALMTTPGYPVFGTHAKYYGGEVFNLPSAGKESVPPRSEFHSRGQTPTRQNSGDQLSQQPHRRIGHPGIFRLASSPSPKRTISSSSTMPLTPPWFSTANRSHSFPRPARWTSAWNFTP